LRRRYFEKKKGASPPRPICGGRNRKGAVMEKHLGTSGKGTLILKKGRGGRIKKPTGDLTAPCRGGTVRKKDQKKKKNLFGHLFWETWAQREGGEAIESKKRKARKKKKTNSEEEEKGTFCGEEALKKDKKSTDDNAARLFPGNGGFNPGVWGKRKESRGGTSLPKEAK